MKAHDATFLNIRAQTCDLNNDLEVLRAEHVFTLNKLQYSTCYHLHEKSNFQMEAKLTWQKKSLILALKCLVLCPLPIRRLTRPRHYQNYRPHRVFFIH